MGPPDASSPGPPPQITPGAGGPFAITHASSSFRQPAGNSTSPPEKGKAIPLRGRKRYSQAPGGGGRDQVATGGVPAGVGVGGVLRLVVAARRARGVGERCSARREDRQFTSPRLDEKILPPAYGAPASGASAEQHHHFFFHVGLVVALYRCNAATTIRHCGKCSSRARRSSSSWIRAGIRNVSRR